MSSPLEQRLRRALAGTRAEPPRPLLQMELPLPSQLAQLFTPAFMKTLRPAAVLAPVIRREDGLSMLFTRRSESLRSHRGQISFPGGRREESDLSAARAALREAQEEVGLPPENVEVIGYLDDYPTISRYLVTPVVGIVSGAPTLVPCAHEVAEVFEVPLEVVLDRRRYERKSFLRGAVQVPFHELNYAGYRIWGATAGMLWDLLQKVESVRESESHAV